MLTGTPAIKVFEFAAFALSGIDTPLTETISSAPSNTKPTAIDNSNRSFSPKLVVPATASATLMAPPPSVKVEVKSTSTSTAVADVFRSIFGA